MRYTVTLYHRTNGALSLDFSDLKAAKAKAQLLANTYMDLTFIRDNKTKKWVNPNE